MSTHAHYEVRIRGYLMRRCTWRPHQQQYCTDQTCGLPARFPSVLTAALSSQDDALDAKDVQIERVTWGRMAGWYITVEEGKRVTVIARGECWSWDGSEEATRFDSEGAALAEVGAHIVRLGYVPGTRLAVVQEEATPATREVL